MASTGEPSAADPGTGSGDTSQSSASATRSTRGPAQPPPGPAVADAARRQQEEALHELRATLGGLAVASRLLSEHGTRLPPSRRRRLQRMHDAEMARLWRLVGGERQTPVEVDLDQVVLPLVEGLRLRGHRVRWLHSRTRATGRPDDIAEIVHILLENAVRHAPGTLITIEPVADASRWRGLRVFDRGAGIPDATLPLLWVRGGRGPGSPGAGLGLHVARRLATEMGGSLVLEPPSSGRGASFRLALPTQLVRAAGA